MIDGKSIAWYLVKMMKMTTGCSVFEYFQWKMKEIHAIDEYN